MTATTTPPINGFHNKYRFLSNFWLCRVTYNNVDYASSEHAFCSQKTTTVKGRDYINYDRKKTPAGTEYCRPTDPGEAKRRAREVTLRPDWDAIKFDIMLDVVRAKFTQNKDLGARLIATGDAQLVENNTHGDIVWGVCKGVGDNWLGIILMQVRDELNEAATQ